MDEIIPGLWLGDLRSALNVELLRSHNISSILSAMRGRLAIGETFIRQQIVLDDTEDADILVHLLPCISFIQSELDKGRGSVLVHCQAGISRSPTIVAAYLMYTQHLEPEAALAVIRQARPIISPSDTFLWQLSIFHEASFKVSRRDKTTRMFYMKRAVEEVMNGDGSPPSSHMFAKYPRTPTDSAPPTPGGPRRRIRCKMCRQELATREHMLDHGQLGSATPRPPSQRSFSRRPSLRLLIENGTGSIMITEGKVLDEGTDSHSTTHDAPSPSSPRHPDSDLAAQLNAHLAALRSPGLGMGMTPLQLPVNGTTTSPPILVNVHCSGYFVEPMKWMDPFLNEGHLSGKIVCPNKRCGAKLGNYDWAGVCCGCKQWVVPGFCIARNKVDEIV